MIDIKREQAEALYNEVRDIILSRKDATVCCYEKKPHFCDLRYYIEKGDLEIQCATGETIFIEINLWHMHRFNRWDGFVTTPGLSAIIYLNEKNEKSKIWELKVESTARYYKAEVTSLEIPKKELLTVIKETSILQDEQESEYFKNEVQENVVEAEPQETRKLFETIDELRGKYLSDEQNKKDILSKKELEIQKVIEALDDLYSKEISLNNNAIVSSKKELNNFDELISKYSTFNIEMIGDLLQQLISIFEGEKYLYQNGDCNTKKIEHGIMDSWEVNICSQIKMIIRESEKNNYYSGSHYSEVTKIIKNGEAILLSFSEIDTQNVTSIHHMKA